jgi:hypothetical protein
LLARGSLLPSRPPVYPFHSEKARFNVTLTSFASKQAAHLEVKLTKSAFAIKKFK